MSVAQMKAQFPDQWLLIAEPRTSSQHEVLSGLVVWHCSDRDELYQKDAEFGLEKAAILFTGEWQKGMEFVL